MINGAEFNLVNVEQIIYLCPSFANQLSHCTKIVKDNVMCAISGLFEDVLEYVYSAAENNLADFLNEEPSRVLLGEMLRGENSEVLIRVGEKVDLYCQFCFFSSRLKIVHAVERTVH